MAVSMFQVMMWSGSFVEVDVVVELSLNIFVEHVCDQGCDKAEKARDLFSEVCYHVLERDDCRF